MFSDGLHELQVRRRAHFVFPPDSEFLSVLTSIMYFMAVCPGCCLIQCSEGTCSEMMDFGNDLFFLPRFLQVIFQAPPSSDRSPAESRWSLPDDRVPRHQLDGVV